MATDPNKPHVHLPLHDNPNHCAVRGCGRSWNYVGHQPSLVAAETLLGASEQPPGSRVLEQHERASGTPFVPSQRQEAAPATHTGRPAMHSGSVYVPSGSMRWIMCPELYRPGAQTARRVRCPFTSPLRQDVAEHLKDTHQYGSLQIGFYLRNPWFSDEDRKTWTDRTQHLRREATAEDAGNWRKTASVQDSEVYEFCTHPDGFQDTLSVDGREVPACEHCGAVGWFSQADPEPVGPDPELPNCPHPLTHRAGCGCPDDDSRDPADAWRTLDDLMAKMPLLDGLPIWGHSIDCPECHNGFIKGNIRRHMQTVHQWTGDQWENWAESVNFLEVPLIPEPIQTLVTVEDIMNAGKPSPPESINCPECSEVLEPGKTRRHLTSHGWTGDQWEDWATKNSIDSESLHAVVRAEQEQNRLELEVLGMNGLEAVLTEWWVKRAQKEAEEVVPKAIEYGSNSLMQVGRKMAQLQGREVNDDEALELGCWSYAIGKVERWTDAVMRGERPSDDTLHDIGVYIKMAQRIRDAGSWPGV